MRDIIFALATQGWQKAVDENDNLEAIDRLVTRFTIPLQSAGAQIEEIHTQFDALLKYATQYVSLSTMDYRGVWWRLFHAPNASEWTNALMLAELLFSLPDSNGTLERVFSQVGVIKSNKRALLSNETLDDLLIVATDDLTLKEFNPDAAIDLWWKEKYAGLTKNQENNTKLRRVTTQKIRNQMKLTYLTTGMTGSSSLHKHLEFHFDSERLTYCNLISFITVTVLHV